MERKTTGTTDGHLKLVFFDGLLTTDYNVMDTDYETYTIIYSCNENKLTKKKNEYVWLLTRTPEFDTKIDTHFKELVD